MRLAAPVVRIWCLTRGGDRILDALALILCVGALNVAVSGVQGLGWPPADDHHRDIAQAQSARDGHPLSDPHYQGEWVWYNPLVPWIVAAGSAITDTEVATFHVQAGPWLNLLAPVAFYLMAVRFSNRGTALLALAIFLFNCHSEPALTCATYSPWLWVSTFAQGLLYLGLLTLAPVHGRTTPQRAVLIGFLGGLTFLAHTGPAVILGLVALFVLDRRALAIAGTTALMVASPYLYAIVLGNGLSVANSVPQTYRWYQLRTDEFPTLLRTNAVIIAAGLIGALTMQQRVARLWLALSAVMMMVFGVARDALPWLWLPAIVPAFHFWRSTMVALTLFAGAAAWTVAARIAGRYAVLVTVAAAITASGLYLPHYENRYDLRVDIPVARQRDPNQDAVSRFLRKATPPDAIVLSSPQISLYAVAPAGRKVVAVPVLWSNPAVDHSERQRQSDAMLDAMEGDDSARFTELADRYGVTHVVGVGSRQCGFNLPELELLYRFGDLCVFRRRTTS